MPGHGCSITEQHCVQDRGRERERQGEREKFEWVHCSHMPIQAATELFRFFSHISCVWTIQHVDTILKWTVLHIPWSAFEYSKQCARYDGMQCNAIHHHSMCVSYRIEAAFFYEQNWLIHSDICYSLIFMMFNDLEYRRMAPHCISSMVNQFQVFRISCVNTETAPRFVNMIEINQRHHVISGHGICFDKIAAVRILLIYAYFRLNRELRWSKWCCPYQVWYITWSN